MRRTNLFSNDSTQIFSRDNCVIKYKVFKTFEDIKDSGDFKLSDLKWFIRNNLKDFSYEIIEIESVYVGRDFRGKGFGSKALSEFCELHKTSLITLTAGIHSEDEIVLRADGLSEESIADISYEVLDKLLGFYSSNGFVNCNDYVGNYDSMRAMLFNNDVFRELNLTQGNI